jgi:capsular polysaccharide biosynthesis protein
MLSEEMDKKKITNLQILESAAVPVTPVRANLRKILGAGLFAAFALSFGFAVACEYIPQNFTTPEAVTRHLKLPVLVAISYKK